ncbi:unnamed protein product [Prorocentrum cordatum]|uniref:Uncharacterized protein n=1 Tax=Prorocentrum cordatum TaxID=2364126 RepID=A0ABN9SW38_9DINO|nr:unnamed protein product [Polarella glacialis]
MELAVISRQTVTACEEAVGSALIGAFRFFHFHCEAKIRSFAGRAGRGHTFISCHSFSSDATNSGVWRNAKLQALKLLSVYIGDHRNVETNGFFSNNVSFEAYADLHKVTSTTAEATMGLIWKQLVSLGCPVWKKYSSVSDGPAAAAANVLHGTLQGEHRLVRILLYTSDGGPDQMKFKRMLIAETALQGHVLVIGYPCLMHRLQLIIKTGLELIDRFLGRVEKTFKYFSSLSKVTQVWRDMAGDIYDIWKGTFGPRAARECAARLPPKCLAGRWDSIYSTEKHLRFCASNAGTGIRQLPAIIRQAVETKKKGKEKRDGNVPALDDAANETSREYSARLGRWRSDVLRTVSDELFWIVVDVATDSHEALQHHMAFVSQARSTEHIETYGNVVAQLIMGKGQEILEECTKCFRNFQWAAAMSHLSDLGEHVLPDMLAFTVELNAHHAAAYNRRILKDLDRSSVRANRSGMASRILEAAEGELEITTRKLRALCHHDLVQARDTGTCGTLLYSITMCMRCYSKADVRDNEQYNSLIRQMNMRCRNIGLPLMSSRINVKKWLGVGTRGASMRWSSIKPRAEALLRQLLPFAEQAQGIAIEDARFEAAKPIETDVNVSATLKVACPVDTSPAALWAKSYSVKLFRCSSGRPDANQLIVVGMCNLGNIDEDNPDDFDLLTYNDHSVGYMMADTNYTTSELLKINLSPSNIPDYFIGKISDPCEFS